ncbi:MAG: peptidase M23 [Ponticaulis sp.]|nr:peptidase M23 [Ponticaulis sp.]
MSAHNIRSSYDAWLADQTRSPVQLMPGLTHKTGELRLDAEGLAERGWSDLPLDFAPENEGVLMGGYLENRSIYDSPVFATPGEEPRNLHLGLDVFAPAGTPVFAPLEGLVHSFQTNNGELDYGPTILLEHSPTEDLTFWTLYGHLSEDSLLGLEEGDPISMGETLAELGGSDVNGGWAPHLHFQIMLDLDGRRGDFPGVCRSSERAKWEAICPDPRRLLGLRSD